MTIGIVARSYIDNCIVAVSDRRISYSDVTESSDDATLKAFGVAPSWGALFSAHDIGPIPEIIENVRRLLEPNKGILSRRLVREAFRQAWWDSANQRVVDLYLAPFGIRTVDEFRNVGREQFGPDIFADISGKIQSFDPGISFLVYGFDADQRSPSNIFHVQRPDRGADLIVDHDLTGFGIIGSGYWPALASLAPRGSVVFDDVLQTVYHCCVAKFCAETAAGVGRSTTVMVFRPNKDGIGPYRVKQFPLSEIDRFREIWLKEREQPIPPEVATIIQSRLLMGKFMTDETD